MIKLLSVRKVLFDTPSNGIPFIEIRVDLTMVDADTGDVVQLITDYGRMNIKISDLDPINITNFAVNGFIDNAAMILLVRDLVLSSIARRYSGTLDGKGGVIIP